jgi:hypothetical protein
MQLGEDEAGPYQAIPQPGARWQPEGHPALQPHEYERSGTAKLLTLFRPATGEIRAKGVVSVTNAVLHPWLKGELGARLSELEKQQPAETLPSEEQRPPAAQWKTWLWPHESAEGLPPLRIILVLDNLAGHVSPDLLGWFFHQGVMPLYTPRGRLVAQHGRVGAAHHYPSSPFWSASSECSAGHRLVGANRDGVE